MSVTPPVLRFISGNDGQKTGAAAQPRKQPLISLYLHPQLQHQLIFQHAESYQRHALTEQETHSADVDPADIGADGFRANCFCVRTRLAEQQRSVPAAAVFILHHQVCNAHDPPIVLLSQLNIAHALPCMIQQSPNARLGQAGLPRLFHIVSLGVDQIGNVLTIGVVTEHFDACSTLMRMILALQGFDDPGMLRFASEEYPGWGDEDF